MPLTLGTALQRAAAGISASAAAAMLVTEAAATVTSPVSGATRCIAVIGLAIAAIGIALTVMPGRHRLHLTAAGAGGLLTTVAWWQISDRVPSGLIWRFISLVPMLALMWSCHLWKSAPHPGGDASANGR